MSDPTEDPAMAEAHKIEGEIKGLALSGWAMVKPVLIRIVIVVFLLSIAGNIAGVFVIVGTQATARALIAENKKLVAERITYDNAFDALEKTNAQLASQAKKSEAQASKAEKYYVEKIGAYSNLGSDWRAALRVYRSNNP